FCLYTTVPHVIPTGARGALWRDLDACGWWQEISPFRSQAPSSRNDSRVSHSERSRGISTSVAGGKRSLHSGRKLPPVEMTGFACRFRSQAPSSRDDSRVDRKSTRLNSSHVSISYAVFCL